MVKHRLLFEKSGRAIYLSHLDLMRTLQRVFARAGIGIRHTEGFNPHAYISVLLPLSVGASSNCELLDFELIDDTPLEALPALLNEKMPEGITVKAAFETKRKVRELAWLDVTGLFEYDGLEDKAAMLEQLAAFFAQDEILITKKTKRKTDAELDIRPMIANIAFEPAEGGIAVSARLLAQNPGLNPNLLVAAIEQIKAELLPDFHMFTRQEVYDSEGNIFR